MAGRLLVVDDNAAIQLLVTAVAEVAGFDVCAIADDGQRAVDLAGSEQPDGVVLDQEMPVMDGISALPLIRSAAPGATVVMFSSSSDASVVQAALHGGAAAYFQKGVDEVEDVVAFLTERLLPAG